MASIIALNMIESSSSSFTFTFDGQVGSAFRNPAVMERRLGGHWRKPVYEVSDAKVIILEWLVERGTSCEELAYRPLGRRITCFSVGKETTQ